MIVGLLASDNTLHNTYINECMNWVYEPYQWHPCVCMGVNQFMINWLCLSLSASLKIVPMPLCVDLSHLNRYVRYQSPTPAEAIADISACKAKFFTVLHAMKDYYQCPLDQESQRLTTFITPFGRFKYMRAP